jgi:hypothetical protein
MDFTHLVQGSLISYPDEIEEYPPASGVEETNSERDEETSEKRASSAPN